MQIVAGAIGVDIGNTVAQPDCGSVGGKQYRIAFRGACRELYRAVEFDICVGDPFTRDTAKVDLYGQGGPDYTIPAEFVKDEYGLPLYTHKRGALAAARRGDLANPMKESSGSQFYLVQNPDACTHLDGEYTVFGETVAGFNVIDRIAGVRTNRMGLPERDVRILTIKPDAELNKKVENTPAGE